MTEDNTYSNEPSTLDNTEQPMSSSTTASHPIAEGAVDPFPNCNFDVEKTEAYDMGGNSAVLLNVKQD